MANRQHSIGYTYRYLYHACSDTPTSRYWPPRSVGRSSRLYLHLERGHSSGRQLRLAIPAGTRKLRLSIDPISGHNDVDVLAPDWHTDRSFARRRLGLA